MSLPLPLQFLAAWLAVWLGRVLQEQVDCLKQENQRASISLAASRMAQSPCDEFERVAWLT
jgi:hypothetical protein